MPAYALCMQPPPGDGPAAEDAEDDEEEEAGGGAAAAATAARQDGGQTASSPAAAATPEETARRDAALKSAARLTKTRFARAASAVYWLGGTYESLAGDVGLSETVSSEQRAAPGASPLVFEVYGDEALLWRRCVRACHLCMAVGRSGSIHLSSRCSEPILTAKALPEPFSVNLVGVRVLRLVTRVSGGNAGGSGAAALGRA